MPDVSWRAIVRYVQLVGQENVMAGSDRGFGTAAGMAIVDPKITWAKCVQAASNRSPRQEPNLTIADEIEPGVVLLTGDLGNRRPDALLECVTGSTAAEEAWCRHG